MKTAVIALGLFVTGLTQAEDITKKEFQELLLSNQRAFEKIEVGMSSMSMIREKIPFVGHEDLCAMTSKRTVLSIDPPFYTVFYENTYLTYCGTNKEGGTREAYMMNLQILSVSEYLEKLNQFGRKNKYSINWNDELMVSWGKSTEQDHGSETIELGLSQFFSTTNFEDTSLVESLVGRKWNVRPPYSLGIAHE